MSHTSIELSPMRGDTLAGIDMPANNVDIAPTREPRESIASMNQPPHAVDNDSRMPNIPISKRKTAIVITCVTSITAIGSFSPAWPVSIYALTCGCTLLLCGTISDVVGSRHMYLVGCLLQAIFTLACGLSRTGPQLIVFRAFSGVAASFCLPSAVSIINATFAAGRSRNMAFAAMGGGQPVGFGLGLVLGGVFAGTIGWEWGFYVAAIVNFVVLVFSVFQLPGVKAAVPFSWHRMAWEIDWGGALIASTCLGMLSYVLAALTGSSTSIRSPATITTLSIAIVLIPAFIFWVGRQERLDRPALIPNGLWRNRIFTSICISVFLIWGVFNAFEQIANFFFQNVQGLSPLQAAIRFLPAPISGALSNVLVGLLVPYMRADWIVIATTITACIAPLLMAVVNPDWTFWAMAFPAVFSHPLGADGLFTISNLLITSLFPAKTQGLAGGVFNTVSQIGKSVGLALVALIGNQVSLTSGNDG